MPVTPFQATIAKIISVNRSPESHLAGAAALHFKPNSIRFSNDLDYFHDSVERVATAFAADEKLLRERGYTVSTSINQPGFIRATVANKMDSTKVEWSHDSAWRFMPAVKNDEVGYQLHPIDLAINKVLALAGRDEPRDLIDVLYIHRTILPLGALCWAASGKDPGFTPMLLLELLKRKGKVRPEDLSRLMLTEKTDVTTLKGEWLSALESADQFINGRSPSEIGCLYYSSKHESFIAPTNSKEKYIVHYGRPGGILPAILQET